MMDISLDSLTIEEKVQLLEKVWASLCQTPADLQSPEWHRAILEDRQRRIENGKATLVPWSEAKARLEQLGR